MGLGPIFFREWRTVPRRGNHFASRAGAVGGLWVLILTIWQTTIGWEQSATLGDQARFSLLTFKVLAYVQLILVIFFSALSAASAVSQEKDRRTYLLLLLTELSNFEIVVGKLLGSLLNIGLLLLASIPVFGFLFLLGGIAFDQIRDTFFVLLTTAIAAGSLGSLVALWRDKTFQSLALTVLFLVLYLCIVQGVALIVPYGFTSDDPHFAERWSAYLAGSLQPFSSLYQILDPSFRETGMASAHRYSMVMVFWTVALNLVGILMLRVWNPSGEPIMQREAFGQVSAAEAEPIRVHAAPGPVRAVWANPILWREVATRAYGRRPLLVKTAYFVVVGLLLYYLLVMAPPRDWAAACGLVPIAILSLLLICAQAVTAITSERDLGALDLLMVTDLSPKEFILGKVLGILWNTKEYLLPPLLLVAVYAWNFQLAVVPSHQSDRLLGKTFESAFSILGVEMLVMAFTVMLGLHVALRVYNSRFAVLNALGTIFFLSVGTLICIYLILINGRFEYQWLSFSGFLFAGVGGLWWVLNGDRPSTALTLSSWVLPVAVFYTITNILIGKPGQMESTDPLIPFLVIGSAFGFTTAAMLIPLMSEFDVAIGRTSAIGE